MDKLFNSTIINRNKVFKSLSRDNNFYLLKGEPSRTREYSDVEIKFRQNSNFFWLTGINLPDCSVIINGKQKKIILVVPDYDKSYTIWNGKIPDLKKLKEKWKFDDITSTEKINEFYFNCNKKLIKVIEKHRIIKNKYEIKLISNACEISSKIHNKIIYNKEIFFKKSEKLISNYFLYHTMNLENVNNLAYPSIVGSGINSAILHYSDGNKIIKSGDTILIDAGCEYLNYASDITTTFPITTFDNYQKNIYNIVVECNKQCKEKVKVGVNFKELYDFCLQFIYDEVKKLGLINENVKKSKKLSDSYIAKLLMPHGLGHFIGLDVHDVGGSLYNYRNKTGGIVLKRNMVITIEPGIYFIRELLDENLDLFNNITDYYHVGGVRIEDVIVVKNKGYKQLNNVVR